MLGCSGGSAIADVHALALFGPERRCEGASAKYRTDRLGQVRELELLVCCHGHLEPWLEPSGCGLGSQGRAVDGECTNALFY